MYLYIFEDGTMCQHAKPPTAEDQVCIEDGILQVVESTGEFVGVLEGVRVTGESIGPSTVDHLSAEQLLDMGWEYA